MNKHYSAAMLILACLLFFALLTSQSLMDLSVALICVGGVAAILRKKSLLFPEIHPYVFPLGGLWLTVILGLMPYLPSTEAFKSILEFRWILELWFVVLIFSQIKNWTLFFKFALLTLGVTTGLALLFYFTGYNPLLMIKDGRLVLEGVAEPRLGGLFGHSMPYAHTYSLAFLLASGFYLSYRKNLSKNWQTVGGIALLFAYTSLIFTYSRGIWLACTGAVLFALVVTKSKSLLKAAALGGVLATVLFASTPNLQTRVNSTVQKNVNGDNQRKVLFQANWLIFKDYPLLGIGYSYNRVRLRQYYDRLNVPQNFFESHAHNQYIQWLSGTGFLGFAFFLWFALLILFQNSQLLRRTAANPQRGLLLGTLMAQVCFLLGGLTEANFSIAKNRTMYLFAIAIFLALKNQQRKSNQTSPPLPRD